MNEPPLKSKIDNCLSASLINCAFTCCNAEKISVFYITELRYE